MKKLKIYLDTSVIGGCFEEDFEEYSNKLFEFFKNGTYTAVISSVVIYELSRAPEKVRAKLAETNYEEIQVTEEMKALADKYMEESIVTKKYYDDALHISIATVLKVDVLVSWNFKHIVNFDKINKFNSVNIREGYGHLEIRTPQEAIKYE